MAGVIRNEAITVLRLDNTQHNQAAAQAATAIGKLGSTGEVSAGQIRAAMRSLPAQFTDVVTQLQGGQSPLTVLIQQGGQVKDQFGGIGNALRGIGSLLSPTVLGVAGMASLAGLVALGARDAAKLRDTIEMTGNAAGLTADKLAALAQGVSDRSKASVGDAKDVVLALAAEGTVSTAVLASMALAVQRVAQVTGKSGDEVAKDFAKMSSGVADWAAEHNKAWNFITAQQYLYIKRLEDQGKAEEAAIYVSKHLSGRYEVLSTNLGTLESAWVKVGKAAGDAWQWMLGVGKENTLADKIDAAKRALATFDANMPSGPSAMVDSERFAAIKAERARLAQSITSLQTDQRMESRLAEDKSTRAARERAKIEAIRTPPPTGGEKLKNYNPGGLFMGPAYLTPEEEFRQIRQADQKGYAQQNDDIALQIRKRQAAQQNLLDDLVKANEDANLQLIEDDQQRAQAQIILERKRLQAQIDQIYGSSPDKADAEASADAAAQAKRQAVARKFAKDTALVTREETRDALANAFRDTKNPIKAFGDALGNIVFQRVSTSLAEALLTQAFGPGGGFTGGLFGSLLGLATGNPASLLSGGTGFGDYNAVADLAGQRAAGGPVMAGEAYLVGERGPEILRMGSSGGTVLPNAALGGHQVSIVQHITFGNGITPAELMPMLAQTKEVTKAEVLQLITRERIA